MAAKKVIAPVAPKKRATDWAAVHRDYRTAKFTLRELATKYGISHQAIAKRAKNEEWTQDLEEEIRQATNSVLVKKLVDETVAKGGQEVANTVLAAAELNAKVIMGHRQELSVARSTLEDARRKVELMGADVSDIREAKTYMDAASINIGATKQLVELERKILGIGEKDQEKTESFEDLLAKAAAMGGFE